MAIVDDASALTRAADRLRRVEGIVQIDAELSVGVLTVECASDDRVVVAVRAAAQDLGVWLDEIGPMSAL